MAGNTRKNNFPLAICYLYEGGFFMKKNMFQWIEEQIALKTKKPLPVLSFPGIQAMDKTVIDLVNSGALQAECMRIIADRFDTAASVSLMDLSVEAEAFGSAVKYDDDEVPTVIGALLADEHDVDALAVPAVGMKRTGEYIEAVRAAAGLITDRPVFAGSIGPFSLSGRLLDMTEIMILALTEPETVLKTLDKATAFIIEYIKAFKEAGANGVVIAEPAAGLLSPELNAGFSVPFIRKIIEAVQDESFVVVYHNCGNTIPLIGDILTTGARVFHFGNAIRMEEMLPLTPPDVLVCGNVDPAGEFKNGTPESVYAATMSVLEKCAGYKNFIISSGCDIPPTSPMENIEAHFRAATDFYANNA